jgi:hypothetical protein
LSAVLGLGRIGENRDERLEYAGIGDAVEAVEVVP